MTRATGCPRCDAKLRPPGLWSSSWQCPGHGPVVPFTVYRRPGPDVLDDIRRRTAVPMWLLSPLPATWAITGLGYAGDDREYARATLLACSGSGPLGGRADALLIAEEPGVGLGARFGGLSGPDPGAGFDDGPPDAKVEAGGHVTPLWSIEGAPGRATFVGEAKGRWVWVVVHPDTAGVLLYDTVALLDLREHPGTPLAPFGALSPLLDLPHAG